MSGDNPIRTRNEDRLGRSSFAGQLAAALLSEAADQGLVAALVGEWGQGKSSVISMVVQELERHERTVLIFNPWMFAGQDQLLSAFFEQIAGQLRLKGKSHRALADRLAGYGQALSPLVFVPVAGAWLGRAGAVAAAVGQARGARKQPDPVELQRREIEEALGKLTEPIFVIVDEIDRLTGREIRDMLGLVRMTAHFPKIIYLLAFDRAKVARALDHDGLEGIEDGRSYLDKIVELPFDLPATSPHALRDLLFEGIDQALTGIATGPFDQARWQDVYTSVLSPLLTTPRDINRYVAALPAALRMIGEEVALEDVLTVEAIRIRRPDVFARLGSISQALTDVGMITSQAPGWQAEVEEFIRSAGEHSAVISEMCRVLFPATARYLGGRGRTTWPSSWLSIWRKQRRVASPAVLAIYLGKQLPPGTAPAAAVEMAVATMVSAQQFQVLVDNLPAGDLEDFLARLEAYEDDISPSAVLPGCTVLLGLYPRLRARSGGFLDFGPEIAVDRVVLRLLRRIGDEAERTRITQQLCATVLGFTGRIRLLRLVGRRPNPDTERLIPLAESDQLYRQVCNEIRHATTTQVAAERDPLWLMTEALAENPADRGNVDQVLLDNNAATALLLSAADQVRSQTLGTAAVRSEPVLDWTALSTVVGDDTAIAAMVNRVAAANADDKEVMAVAGLARQYLDGWRPPHTPFGRPEPVIRQPHNHPNMIFSPSTPGGWPALHIRAATTFEVDPAWAPGADVSGAEFHQRLTAFLDGIPLAGNITALAGTRNLPADASGWGPDPDSHQSVRSAVQRLTLGPEGEPTAVLRYAVFLPGSPGPMTLIADIAVSPQEATDARWCKLGLGELRDVLDVALDAAAGPGAGQLVQSIYSGEMPPRTTIELHLTARHGQGGSGRTATLHDLIDLDPLGAQARTDQPALQGMFAVDGDTPAITVQDRRNLVMHALIRMALDWGYLDARAAVVPLATD
jgi:hypothetical protein